MFIEDGEVFHQIYRGEMDEEDMYAELSDTLEGPAKAAVGN